MIAFTGAKGGVGTSVVAAATALLLARSQPTTLTAADLSDMAAVLGCATPADGASIAVTDTLTLTDQGEDLDVYDIGMPVSGARNYLVTRPCYLALRRAISQDLSLYDGVVLITEPGRALDERDVASTLGLPIVAVIPYEPAVARAVDAGLLGSRLPSALLTLRFALADQ